MTKTNELNNKLGSLIASGKDINSNECKEIIDELKVLKDRELYLKSLFGEDINIFDTFVSVEDISYNHIIELCNRDIFLPLYKHSSAGFNADASQIGRGYTDRNIGEAISNFKISFDDYFGLRIEGIMKFNNEFIGVWLKPKDSKKLFHISGDYVEFRGGHRIDNCQLHIRDLVFSSDFKHIKYGRGSDTALNSFCKYSTKQSLKEWLMTNKETLEK